MRQTAVLSLFFAGTLVSSTAAFGADAQLMNLVMPDAKILAGVNATSLRISPLGQFLIARITANGFDLQKFSDTTGFNPLQDVSEVLVASPADPANPSGLALVRGTFPVDKITSLANGHANVTVQTYSGATLVSVANPKEKIPHAVAFIGNSIAVAGDVTSVKAALDRASQTNSIDPALAAKVNQLSATQDEWLVSSTSIASLIPAKAPADAPKGPAAQVLPLLKSIQSFNGGLKLGNNLAFTGEALTNDPKNAAALQAVVQLGITLASSAAGSANDPHLAEAVQLLQALQVSASGSTLNLSLLIPESQIENLVKTSPARAKIVRTREFHNGN